MSHAYVKKSKIWRHLNSLDVNIQDQTSPPFEHFLYNETNTVTILNSASIFDYQLTLAPGHGFAAPLGFAEHFIVIRYVDDAQESLALKDRFLQTRVVAVAEDVISLGNRLSFDIDPAKVEDAFRVSANMAVAGSLASPVRFFTSPPNNASWDITRIMFDMILATGADDGKFGNLTALANGVFFGFEGDNFTEYLVNIIDNGGLRASMYDINYTVRSGGTGDFGLSGRKSAAGQDKFGVAIRLNGRSNDDFVKYIQDDLTLLQRYRIKIMGHLVID